MGSSRKSHRTEHAARFSAGAALTQVCAAAQARLCAACAAAVVRRSRQVETQVFGLPLYSWPSRDLARIHRIPGCEIFVHFFEPLRIGVRPRTGALGRTCGGSGDVGVAGWVVVIVVILTKLTGLPLQKTGCALMPRTRPWPPSAA